MTEITTIVVGDTETTGMDPAEGAALLEVCLLPLQTSDAGESPVAWTPGEPLQWFVEHEGEIPAEARAVHHLRPEQVRPGAPNCHPRGVMMHEVLCAEVPGEMMYAFHNAPFDVKFLPELGCPVIDTCQCARHIWPDAPKYSNQVLRYWLGVEPEERLLYEEHPQTSDEFYRQPLAPHRAQYDVAVTSAILARMLETHTPEELLRLSTTPLLLITCNFKKHKGEPWSQVPRSYLSWMMREGIGRDDPNLLHTIRHYLEA